MGSRAVPLAVLLALALACGGVKQSDTLRRGTDAPFDLAEDQDLRIKRAELVAMPASAAGRADLRRRLASEYGRRLALGVRRGHHRDAYEALSQLMSLWTAEE